MSLYVEKELISRISQLLKGKVVPCVMMKQCLRAYQKDKVDFPRIIVSKLLSAKN